jgi:hypothetical protein
VIDALGGIRILNRFKNMRVLVSVAPGIRESSSSGHEVKTLNDLFRPYDCICLIFSLMVVQICDKSCDTSVGIALGCGLDDRGSRIRFPAGTGNFSLHYRVQNGSGAHSASYPMGNRGSFPEGKAAGEWSWPLTSI